MAIYNDSVLNNVTNPVDIFVGIGTAMGDTFLIGNLLLLSFFLIFLILAMKFDLNEVLIIDGFLTTVFGILIYISGLISATTIIYPTIIFFLALIFYLVRK
tara:strand:- start:51 stop:353 length:303 start_codon:yes stop_codon:yes gene_type:complete